ncbi:hypothetical protein LTR53_009939 [Teratosphaeriaceae sp. CCFEE 6253]|nr:hypothetical protein LTR53_009939 [Teratosphaeriaceae sp. CCFEE 6253]
MPGSGHRFTTPTPWDRQPAIWVTTTLFATWCILCLVVRLWIRRKIRAPEYALLIAYALAASSWATSYAALTHGAGISTARLEEKEYSRAGETVFTSTICLIAAKGVAASASALFLDEIVAARQHRLICRASIAFCLLSAVIACLVVSVNCSPQRALSTGADASCPNAVARWNAASALFVLQTFANVALPVFCFRKIQITRLRRLNAMAWFSVPPLMDLVLLGIVISQYTHSFPSKPSGTGLVGFLVSLDSSLCWTLIYPTIPCLRPTALSYATGGVKATVGSNSASRSYNISHPSSHRTTELFSQSKRLDTDEVPLRPVVADAEGNHTNVAAGNHEREETVSNHASSDPRSIRITHEYQVSTNTM